MFNLEAVSGVPALKPTCVCCRDLRTPLPPGPPVPASPGTCGSVGGGRPPVPGTASCPQLRPWRGGPACPSSVTCRAPHHPVQRGHLATSRPLQGARRPGQRPGKEDEGMSVSSLFWAPLRRLQLCLPWKPASPALRSPCHSPRPHHVRILQVHVNPVRPPCPARVRLGRAASPQPGWLVPGCVHNQPSVPAPACDRSVVGGWLSCQSRSCPPLGGRSLAPRPMTRSLALRWDPLLTAAPGRAAPVPPAVGVSAGVCASRPGTSQRRPVSSHSSPAGPQWPTAQGPSVSRQPKGLCSPRPPQD